MQIVTATATSHETGPLTQVVNRFVAAQGAALAAGITGPESWDPVAAFVDVANFRRVGAYLEELDWPAYRDFLTGWAAGGTRFEMTTFHVSEIGNAVFQEIEERHWRGGDFIRKNVIAVYRFTPDGRIAHLDIYEQARDSGDWIREAAKGAEKAAG
ncbi:MAG TPA: hypothetical protein PKD92_05985 [Novosphingobium sp.]|nr:hypothetical protein [Novosphingobium sp.]HMP56106.1 hypothetical protein [Novosphingobium sp.]